MKKLILILLFITFQACSSSDKEDQTINNTIEGKWTFENNNLNTMYIFKDSVRYTYYCVEDQSDCYSLYNTYEAGDGNHLPTTNPYTFKNGILTVDLHFGNELVATLTFECNGGKVFVESLNPYYLFRLGFDCN